MIDRTISIFEEYCNSVETLPGGDSVEVKINGKYFTELYTRVMLHGWACLLYTSPSPRDVEESRMPSSA